MIKKVAFFLLFLSGCTPFIDARREAGSLSPVGQSRPKMPAICYNGWINEPEELIPLAQESCPNEQVTFKKSVPFSCTLFYPSTAFFSCSTSQKKRN